MRGNHILDFGRFIFLLHDFLNSIPRIAIRICIKLPQSNEVKSNSNIIWTVSPNFLAAPAIPLAALTALITSPATSLTRFIALVIPFNTLLVTPLTAESIPDIASAILLVARLAIWLAKFAVSDIAACTSPNHMGVSMQKIANICSRNFITVVTTTMGTN